MTKTDFPSRALVLGVTGGLGNEVAQALRRRGCHIRALHRDPAEAGSGPAGAHVDEWRCGDAMDARAVMDAARDVSLIVHAVNPPGYRHWDRFVLPMIDHSIAAAKASGARILLPGNVYNFGIDAFADLHEATPQTPCSRKGEIRAEMERRLRLAAVDGVRSLVLRTGDFFGPGARGNWFSRVVVRAGQPLSNITLLGGPGVGHQWAYLPDVAQTFVRLLEHASTFSSHEVFHMTGHWDADGMQLAETIRRTSGRSDLALRRFPWKLVRLAAPIVPLCREMNEMRYLWQHPVYMPNDRLRTLLSVEPHTPWDDAISTTLSGLGCLPQPTATRHTRPSAHI